MNWNEAMKYASSLRLGEFDDWRLPTIEELKSLIDINYKPTIDPIFQNIKPSSYWSSSTDGNHTSVAWYVYFYYGNDFWHYKSDYYFVRCVRVAL